MVIIGGKLMAPQKPDLIQEIVWLDERHPKFENTIQPTPPPP